MDKTLEFTRDWTSKHFPKWREVLRPFIGRENIRALELGTYEGRSALFFLQEIVTHPSSRLFCVDLWHNRDHHRRFLQNLLVADVHDRCEVRKGDSHQILRGMKQRFEFAYIDADHRAHSVLSDAIFLWPLLSVGGVLIFDDYLWTKEGVSAPKLGIDAFLQVFEGQYTLLHKDWQVIIQKK